MKNDVYCQKFSIQIDPKFTIRLTEQKRSFENKKFVYNVILPKFSVEIKKCNKFQKYSQNSIFQVVVHQA